MEVASHSRPADYIIVGGGTAALVVACRLSENPNTRIIVLERGRDESKEARVKDPLAYESLTGSEMDWNLRMAPQAGLNNREFHQSAGKAVGGSSMINGCIFLPPAAAGLDAWSSLGNPGWNWETLAPYNRIPTATGVEVQTKAQGTVIFKPTKEVIMGAGVFNNPKILELSGIGDTDRLQELGIPPLVHLPGVGENLSNHAMSLLTAPLKDHPGIKGIAPGMKANAFIRLGPPDMHGILAGSRERNDYTAISGILDNPNEASACIHFAVYPGDVAVVGVFPSYPFSRGSSHIQSTDPADDPLIDPKCLTSPSDLDSMVRHVQHLQRILRSTHLHPFVDVPPPNDIETLTQVVRESMAIPTAHPCGTTAMLPREKGGVVGPDLKVYGVSNVRVVDASIFPLVPQANPISTVYTVAERAANLIRAS